MESFLTPPEVMDLPTSLSLLVDGRVHILYNLHWLGSNLHSIVLGAAVITSFSIIKIEIIV